jgi:NhaA family Na+:H+ antiporter
MLDHLVLLPLGASVAMLWVNTLPETYYRFTYAISFAVNDVAMVFFFGLITKEVVEATAPGGVLHTRRRVWMPIVAAIGATAVPALLYVRAVDALDEPMLAVAWPVSLAVDIAISYFIARLIFRRHAMLPFILLLAIASNVAAFAALAWFNPGSDPHPLAAALGVAVAIGIALGLRRSGVKSFWPYVIAGGGTSWCALFWSGFQPALALVPIVPFLAHARRDPGFLVDAAPTASDALSRFELWWRYPAHVTLFFFGLVNAGVPLHALEPGTWGLPIAVIAGRPVGVVVAAAMGSAAGLRLPEKVTWRDLIVAALAASVGFSAGLFVSSAFLPAGQVRSELNMGVLLTLLAGPLAFAVAKILRVGRFFALPSPH